MDRIKITRSLYPANFFSFSNEGRVVCRRNRDENIILAGRRDIMDGAKRLRKMAAKDAKKGRKRLGMEVTCGCRSVEITLNSYYGK